MGSGAQATAGLVFAAALGAVVGSFLNVVIHRLPREESIVHPRSRCPGCQRTIAAWDNVPLFAYLWLRGRCRHCGMRISPRYPLIEGLGAVCFAALFAVYGLTPEAVLLMVFAALLITAAGVDFDHGFIPDEVSLGGLALGLTALPAAQAAAGDAYGFALAKAALGALLGGAALWSVGFAHARLSVALGRSFPHWPGEGATPPRPRELDYWIWFPGLGFGDVKLIAMIGAFLGPTGVVYTILLGSLLGLPIGLLLTRGARNGLATPFGFGPALAVAAFVVALALPHGSPLHL